MKIRINNVGFTRRIVIINDKIVLKMPYFPFETSLKFFFLGIVNNIQERDKYRLHKYHEPLCPVWFSFFGFINIMPYCEPADDKLITLYHAKKMADKFHIELKADSYGIYKNELVAVDYPDAYYCPKCKKFEIQD